jgi:hypothetical protein
MPDEPVAVRRKIGLEGRYDGREYAAGAFTLRQNLSFQHSVASCFLLAVFYL